MLWNWWRKRLLSLNHPLLLQNACAFSMFRGNTEKVIHLVTSFINEIINKIKNTIHIVNLMWKLKIIISKNAFIPYFVGFLFSVWKFVNVKGNCEMKWIFKIKKNHKKNGFHPTNKTQRKSTIFFQKINMMKHFS